MIQDSQFQTISRARKLGNAITSLRNRNAQSMGLTAAQSEAIRFILRYRGEEPLTAAGLTEALQLSQSTVAGILNRLEAKEFIRRVPAPEDRRKCLILPTQKGLELEERLRESAAKSQQILFQGMTEAEQREFDRLLAMGLQSIQSAREAWEHENN